MDHIIGFPYPFSNSALKNWPCTKQCFSAIICTFSSINVSQRRKNWPPHHHRILPKKKLAICWWAHHMPRWSEPRAPTNKQGGGGGGREGRGGEGGWGRRGSVSGRWQGNWPPLDIAPGSQALGADLKKVNEKEDKKEIEYLQNESGVAGHRDQGCWNRN